MLYSSSTLCPAMHSSWTFLTIPQIKSSASQCRFISKSCTLAGRTHYQTLGLPNIAKQTDIKNAYYRLSMKFHPDKQKGSNEKFREITAAYEVLGNPRLRTLYDRGILSDNPDALVQDTEYTPDIMEHQSEKAKETVRSFDQYSTTQTTKAFYRTQQARRINEMQRKFVHNKTEDIKSEVLLVIIFMLVLIIIGASGGAQVKTWNRKIEDNETKKKS